MSTPWVGHTVVDNATIGRLETLTDEFENLDPKERNYAYMAEDRAREALGNLKQTGAAMEKAQERMKVKFREMLDAQHDLEAALMRNSNAEELTDKLQDAGTYILGVISIKFIVAGATVALVSGLTLTAAGEILKATRAEGEEDIWGEAAGDIGTVVGTGDDVLDLAADLGMKGAKGARTPFGGALTVVSAASDAWEAVNSEPVVARLEGNTSESYANLREQIDRQSAFSNKGELHSQAIRAEGAQNAYNRAVQEMNRKTLAYARELAKAQQVTWSKPR